MGEELHHQGDRGRAVEQVEEGVVPRQAVAHLPEAAVVQALGGQALVVEAVAGGLEARPQVVGQGTRHDEESVPVEALPLFVGKGGEVHGD